jgi:hypothetical protein
MINCLSKNSKINLENLIAFGKNQVKKLTLKRTLPLSNQSTAVVLAKLPLTLI